MSDEWNTRILIAAGDPSWLVPTISVVAIVGLTAFIFGLFWLVRRLIRLGADALRATYTGLDIHPARHAGDVELVFLTYFGLAGGGYQCKHHVFLPPEQAGVLLKRLHRFNLRWGWLCPGGIFVPFLSYANYRSQLRVIRAQTASRLG